MSGFAIRLETVEPVHHLVGLAMPAEGVGAAAAVVADGGRGDVVVTTAAIAVATSRVALVPLPGASSVAAWRRVQRALTSLEGLSDGRAVAALAAAAGLTLPHALAGSAVQSSRWVS